MEGRPLRVAPAVAATIRRALRVAVAVVAVTPRVVWPRAAVVSAPVASRPSAHRAVDVAIVSARGRVGVVGRAVVDHVPPASGGDDDAATSHATNLYSLTLLVDSTSDERSIIAYLPPSDVVAIRMT